MSEVGWRLAFLRIWSGVLVQTKGCLRLFQPVMNWRILALRSFTEVNTPRRMACRSMMPNHTSTRFSQDPGGGCEVHVEPWALGQPVGDFGGFVGGVVVHHQVQVLMGVGAVELA